MQTILKLMMVVLVLLSASFSHAQREVPVPALTAYHTQPNTSPTR